MGAIGGLLGTKGGFNGTGVSAPTDVTDPAQIEQAYKDAQSGLSQQQAFANAVQPGTQQALQSQQQLLSQLQLGAQGQGPNPALAQLNQSTGANVANQAALMAGQRGSSANTGLIARQAAQQGAATQQQAAGQGATMAAQQQLAQQQALAQQQSQLVNQGAQATGAYTQASQGEQNNLLGAQAGLNTNRTQLIGQAATGQQNLLGNVAGGVGSALGLAKGGEVPQKMATGGPTMLDPGASGALQPAQTIMPAVSTPAPVAPIAGPQSKVGQHFASQDSGQPLTGASQAGNVLGKGIGAGLSALFGSGNGASGSATNRTDDQAMQDRADANIMLANHSNPDVYGPQEVAPQERDLSAVGGASDLGSSENAGMGAFGKFRGANGGKVPALLSPGERYLSPDKARAAAGGQINPMKEGQKVPGTPKVGGAKNSYANDTVKAELEPGGIVIPRSVTQSKDAEKKAIAFVQAHYAKSRQGLKQGKK